MFIQLTRSHGCDAVFLQVHHIVALHPLEDCTEVTLTQGRVSVAETPGQIMMQIREASGAPAWGL